MYYTVSFAFNKKIKELIEMFMFCLARMVKMEFECWHLKTQIYKSHRTSRVLLTHFL